ncbi:hypothetical protein FACS1894147_06540 [Spirochaetia bacterium]|nr:hypothetical protein FACS1894147_06540 [Spirochaetia bacterium]
MLAVDFDKQSWQEDVKAFFETCKAEGIPAGVERSRSGNDAHRIILATGKYLGEGFDLPCLDTLFLVFPFSWKGTLIQYAGRLNRTYYRKTETRIYDYVDEKVPVLLRMYNKRVKGYKALGFSISE